MMFPLTVLDGVVAGADLAIALALGIGFGFVLERAGFGSARKLTAVFYLYDMAVREGDVHRRRHHDGRSVRAVRSRACSTWASSTSSRPTWSRKASVACYSAPAS